MDGLLNWPVGGAFYSVDLLNGLLMIPLRVVFGQVLGFNLLVWGHLVAGGVAVCALARRYTDRRLLALLAGFVYAFSPFVLTCPVGSGVSERLNIVWLPLFFLLLLEILERPRVATFLLAAGVVHLAGAGCWNYAIITYLVAGMYSLWLLGEAGVREGLQRGLWATWGDLVFRKLLPLAALCGAALLPLYLMARGLSDGLVTVAFRSGIVWDGKPPITGGSLPLSYSLLPLEAGLRVLPGQDRLLVTGYFGWLNLIFAVPSLFSRRRHARFFLPAALLLVFLSMGPFLLWDERGPGVPSGLYLTLLRVVPFLHLVNIVDQFAWAAAFCFALAGAAGLDWILDRLGGRARTAVAIGASALVVAELVLLSPVPMPVPSASVTVPGFHADLARMPGAFGVFDFPGRRGGCRPTTADTDHSEYLFYQTVHGKGIPYAVNRGTSWIASDPFWKVATGTWCDLTADRPEQLAAGREVLERMGYRYLILHTQGLEAADRVRFEEIFGQMFGPAVSAGGGLRVFTVGASGGLRTRDPVR